MKTASIPHPNHPGMAVQVHKPTRRDRRRTQEILSVNRVPVAILDPSTNAPYVNKGEVQFAWRVTENDSVTFASLSPTIDGFTNVVDESGNVVPFEPRNVPVLADEHLDVTLPEQEPQAFSYYISELVTKGDIFNVDPTAPASSTS